MDDFDLGRYSRPITTRSAEAQRWFDIGLNWCYGFNHDEGLRAFERAMQADPGCAMLHWGAAYAAGPFYNLTWREHGAAEADRAARIGYAQIRQARARSDTAAPVERDLIEALACRFQQPHGVSPAAFDRWDDDYAAAMRRVYARFPDDHDVMALLVEALMMRTVRRLWDLKTGAPAPGSDVLEALAVCERSIAVTDAADTDPHPAIVHLHIHLMEMSTQPERALRSAERLGTMCPDAGHMNHMPAHIYVLCGEYGQAKLASQRAVRANDLYLARSDGPTYYLLGCCHDLHLMMMACMLLGQATPALWAADKVRSLVTHAVVSLPDRPKLTQTVEGYYAMRAHVLVRFGQWQAILDEPMVSEPALYLLTAAMQHYAKGVAHATLGQHEQALAERERFHRHVAGIPADRRFLSNPTQASLAVGAALLDGEIAYHAGEHATAYAHLRQAVERDDNLAYTEPWAWMHPPRHALAALLLDQGHVAEAEAVYRDDLGLSGTVQRCAHHPNNVWALHGLAECLRRRGDMAALNAMQGRLDAALAQADVAISSSCLCRTSVLPGPRCCDDGGSEPEGGRVRGCAAPSHLAG